jgi:hypothetical protein
MSCFERGAGEGSCGAHYLEIPSERWRHGGDTEEQLDALRMGAAALSPWVFMDGQVENERSSID